MPLRAPPVTKMIFPITLPPARLHSYGQRLPLPPDSPLLAQPGLFLTPHVAAAVEQAVQGSCRAACQGVVEVLTGQPVTWPANHPLPVQE